MIKKLILFKTTFTISIMMFSIATTRFNNDSFIENERWRERNCWKGCVYGTPIKIKECVAPNSCIFVIEMNNDENKIMGVGLIKNTLSMPSKRIYSAGNYNRYTYKGKRRLSRTEVGGDCEKVLCILEELLFKGSRHMKRGQGITKIPEWICNNRHVNFTRYLKEMFGIV
jgi:hypothetical protein